MGIADSGAHAVVGILIESAVNVEIDHIWFMAGGRFIGDAHPRRVPSVWQIKRLFGDAR
jgi:hypothetical protein